MQLGNLTFPNNIIQGPLAGVSCAPFRLLTWRYGKPAFCCTEMISCKTVIHQPKLAQKRYLAKDPAEGPVCFQLAGNNPIELAEAVKIVTDAGADLVDLNCGCPVNKIRSKGAGSGLLTQSALLYQLIRAMKQSTHVPVSIKIRVEGGSGDKFNQEIAKVVADAGVDFLVVHGRHWTEHYETPCNYDEIRFFVENLKIPVIGNGDIADIDSLQKMLSTGCAGVMIGRAGVGQPWLPAKLLTELQGEKYIAPSLYEVGQIFLEHVQRLAELLGNEKLALMQARKMAKYYMRHWSERTQFCESMNTIDSIANLIKILPSSL